MCCTSLTSAAVLFIESHKGICTTAHTTLKAKVLSFLSYAAHCNYAYIHQQTIALVHQASTYTVSLWWVVQLHQAFLLGGGKHGQGIQLCYRQKRLCRVTERRRGLSATRIHSTVGQQALLVNVPQTFQTCACIVIETTEFFPILEVSSSSGWLDLSSLHKSCLNYYTSCVFHATANTMALISSNTLFFRLISIFSPIYLSCLELQVYNPDIWSLSSTV